jgi:hypothetical protein
LTDSWAVISDLEQSYIKSYEEVISTWNYRTQLASGKQFNKKLNALNQVTLIFIARVFIFMIYFHKAHCIANPTNSERQTTVG